MVYRRLESQDFSRITALSGLHKSISSPLSTSSFIDLYESRHVAVLEFKGERAAISLPSPFRLIDSYRRRSCGTVTVTFSVAVFPA